jgi:hypothetical protein
MLTAPGGLDHALEQRRVVRPQTAADNEQFSARRRRHQPGIAQDSAQQEP